MMKHFYRRTGMLFYLIIASTLRIFAQEGKTETISTASEFIKVLRKTGSVQNKLRKEAIALKLDKDGTLSSNIEYFQNDQGLEIYTGKVWGEENSHVKIEVKNDKIFGTITLVKKKRAYKYSTTERGNVVLQETDISNVLCIDYSKAKKTKSKRAIAGPPPGPNPYTLHSNINAPFTVYLDFDGEYVNSPDWPVIDAAPSGMTAEQIITAWTMVAEDYAPFNVDITTERAYYDSKPYVTKHMNIFTPTNTAAPNQGGVAYTGSFGTPYFCPSWTFNMDGKNGGEAAAHEIGHSMGLMHDGTTTPSNDYYWGQGNWAPIMGAGYLKAITQWSKGEYQYASNTQDDLAIISSKVGYKTDDFGNTTSTTSLIQYYIIGSNSVGPVGIFNFNGLISKTSDVDVFKFGTNGGMAKIDVSSLPSQYGTPIANLDTKLDILNSAGTVIASYDQAGLDVNINIALSAGIYYLRIDGTGNGNPLTDGYSDYGSIGTYNLYGTIELPVTGMSVVNINYPETGTEFVNPGIIKIKPEIITPHNINKVEYFDGGVKLGESNASTNSNHFFDVNNLLEGTHSFTIKAWSGTTLVSTSSASTITVYRNQTPVSNTSNKKPGLIYDYYEGSYTALPNFSSLTSVYRGMQYGNLDLTILPVRADNFALRYTGYIRITSDGFYKISLASDDGSKLYLNNKLIINNDGNHALREMTAKTALVAGYYPITIEYYDATSLQDLKLTFLNAYNGQNTYTEFYHDDIEPLPQIVKQNKLLQGVAYEYNEGTYDLLPNFSTIPYAKKGGLNDFNLSVPNRKVDNFAIRYTGLIIVDYPGEYKFFLRSDDGSKLYIDDILVVNNDGTHGVVEKSGSIWLWNGKHKIRVEYFEKTAAESLSVLYSGPGVYQTVIPSSKLMRDPLLGEQTPYSNYIPDIPGASILAENYDQGGEGYAYHDNTTGNQFNAYRSDGVDVLEYASGRFLDYRISGIQDGEWLEYTVNVIRSGPFNILVKCSSGTTTSKLHFEKNGVAITPVVNVPPITDGSTIQTIVIPNITLPIGQQVLRISFDKGGFMLDDFSFQDASVVREDLMSPPTNQRANISVYPNPFDDNINIALSSIDNIQGISIYSLNGTAVWNFSDVLPDKGSVISLGAIPAGMYIVEVKTIDKVLHSTIIKE